MLRSLFFLLFFVPVMVVANNDKPSGSPVANGGNSVAYGGTGGNPVAYGGGGGSSVAYGGNPVANGGSGGAAYGGAGGSSVANGGNPVANGGFAQGGTAYGGHPVAYGGVGGTGGSGGLGGIGVAYGGGTSTETSQSQNSTTSVNAVNVAGSTNYPNQAPPIYQTSSPSFSNRNCRPVGSVNATTPLAGAGVAFPMAGNTCDALNISDIMDAWVKNTGNQRLWLVECNLLVIANDDLEEAFEKSQYSCQQAYIDQKAALTAKANQEVAIRRAMRQ